MPWMETCAMDERIRFILEATVPGVVMTEVCGRFGISRKTGYKWLERYREEGLRGLFDRSRAPSRRPQALGQRP
jgi:transposase